MRNWLGSYNRTGEVIEIIIRDNTGAKLDTFKCNIADFHKIAGILKRKYNLEFSNAQYKKDKDLDWAQ